MINEKNYKYYNNKNISESKKNININQNNTLIILDWDDTLYPTSWILANNIDVTDNNSRYKYINYFNKLDEQLSSTLRDMQKLGHTIIITNAMPEWIELSLSMLPKTISCIKNIDVISARKRFQNTSIMSEWKKLTFKDELTKRLTKYKYINILSIGDADYEYNALIDLYKWDMIPHKYLKSVKFIKSSDYDVLIEQIKTIKKYIKKITSAERHLDLIFSIQ